MEKSENLIETNDKKTYLPPQIEIIEVVVKKSFQDEDPGGKLISGGPLGP